MYSLFQIKNVKPSTYLYLHLSAFRKWQTAKLEIKGKEWKKVWPFIFPHIFSKRTSSIHIFPFISYLTRDNEILLHSTQAILPNPQLSLWLKQSQKSRSHSQKSLFIDFDGSRSANSSVLSSIMSRLKISQIVTQMRQSLFETHGYNTITASS